MDKTTVDTDLAQVFRRHSLRHLLEQLREHCYNKAEEAAADGCSGGGWLEMFDRIDEIIPTGNEDDLFGNHWSEVPSDKDAWRLM